MTAAATIPGLCSHCLLPIRARGYERQVQGEEHLFCCYGCCLAFQVTHGEGEESEAAWLLIRLGIGAFLAMNIMLFSLLLYSGTFEHLDAEVRQVIHLVLWALATPVMLILGWPLFHETLRAAAQRHFTSTTLISIGAGAAYGFSALAVVMGRQDVYFDTATMLLVLFTLGRFLDASGRARAMRDLAPMLAVDREPVTVLEDGAEARRLVRDVKAGTLVLVRPGERIAVDGFVVEGSSCVVEAVITGESRPISKAPGAAVLAGSINHEGVLLVRSAGSGTETRWAQIALTVRQALTQPSHAQRLADQIAGAFVPAVLILAAITMLGWAQRTSVDQALLTGLTVLVVACPCGLGLAGALATTLGIGRLARRGCLVRGGHILEALAGIRAIAFDKTGTLTMGAPHVTSIDTDGTSPDQVLRVAAGLERSSEHPLARAIIAAAAEMGIAPAPATQARAVPGGGILGQAEGDPVAAGSGTWLAQLGWQVPAKLVRQARGLAADGSSLVFVGWAGNVHGVLALGDTPLPEAQGTVQTLRRMGLLTVLLTGDRAEAAARIAAELGVDSCEAGLSPDDKRAALGRWRNRAGHVAMVGDGLNDGPVLAAADVGIAVGSATDLARETAGIVLPAGGLRLLPWVIGLSQAVRRTILTNLLWAFGYNSIGLVLAVTGYLQPVIAAVLMAGSSLLVVLNTLRLERLDAAESMQGAEVPVRQFVSRNIEESGAGPSRKAGTAPPLPQKSQ
jgi:Cu2+-exporting ATPase